MRERLLHHVKNFVEAAQMHHGCVSLSGGLDSVALFHLLACLRSEGMLQLEALHVNFRLRGAESDADEDFVRDLCQRHGVPIHVVRAEEGAGRGQEWAREFRLSAQAEIPRSCDLVEAHHGDDQVETFLFRLFRGSGRSGLSAMSAMSEREGRRVLRPFLWQGGVSRSDLEAFQREEGFAFRVDSSNQASHYDRNFLRNEILPSLEGRFPQMRRNILRLVQELQRERADLRKEALTFELSSRFVELDLERLRALSESQRRRLLSAYFSDHLHVVLSYDQILALSECIALGRGFPWNGPQNLVIVATDRGDRLLFFRMKSGVKEPILRPSSHPRKRQGEGVTIQESTLY